MADETNLYVWDSGTGKFVKFTQPASADQAQVVHSSLDAVSGSTLVRLSEAFCYYYLSTKPTAVTLPGGTPGAWSSLVSAGSPVTTLVQEALCAHATPNSFTYNGIGANLMFMVAGSLHIATQSREVQIGIIRTRSATPTALAGNAVLFTGAANQVGAFTLFCNDTAQNGDVYTVQGRMNDAGTNAVILQSLMVHADGAVGNDTVNDNEKKLATLVAALRSALYDIKLIKGGA